MAEIVHERPLPQPDVAPSRGERLAEWRLRPRQVSALLQLRWLLGLRLYRRSVSAVIGLVTLLIFILSLALGAGLLTALGYINLPRAAAGQLLFAALGLLYLAWAALPVLQYSVNEGLDVTKLQTYPITRAERMVALTLATLFDPSTLIIAGVYVAVTIGWSGGALAVLISVVALALLYVHIVGASQLILAALMNLLRSRRYRDLSIVVLALFSALCSLSGQFATVLARRASEARLLGRLDLGHYEQWLPPGMAARAIIAANAGDPLGALPWLGALFVLTPALLALWAWTLDRGVTTPETSGARVGRRGRKRVSTPAPLTTAAAPGSVAWQAPSVRKPLISPVIAAVMAKDLRYFWRDPQIKASLLSSLVLLFVVFAPNLTHSTQSGGDFFSTRLAGYQVLLAPLPALLIVLTLSLNALGLERQGLQTLFLTPARPLDILWGKNLAVGVVAVVAQVILVVAVGAVSGDWRAIPLALIEGGSATFALLGMGNLTSVLLPLRVRQLRMGQNNLSSESGCLRSVISLAALWATLLALTPVFVLLLLPALIGQERWLIISAPLALIYGMALYQVATLLIAPRMLKRAPEILANVARDV